MKRARIVVPPTLDADTRLVPRGTGGAPESERRSVMHRSLIALAVLTIAGCADRLPEAVAPPTSSASSSSSEAKERSEAKGSSEGKDDDEIAEEKAIVNDPAVIAAAEKVKVIQNDHVECPTELVGLVDVHEPVDTEDKALTILRRKAAKMGADAVMGVEFHHGEPGEEPTHLSGMAVRCKDLLKGRKYDVIGKIEVQGKMGKEDEADKELLERAGKMHADLVIDIGFEHGEGGSQPTKVWGTAIRFK
jgi:uncharacterized protein YbjQ (UPF0145 family)